MKQYILAQKIGVVPKHLSDIKNGRRRVTPSLALKIEQVTGIDRRKWLWPDEFGCPWEELKKI
ncbi:helix-turn-helix transcriptional regulator [Desulfoluna spongiiphila]|uniref:helix-turn-helix transcriptional regulator n=1 Tax=Desulfoluna spongiiphila TaxID=419481 RepID=UPI001113A3E2|nr:helix-turn-helix domain-containing protein [Desulfoluna spongiiphila]